MKLIDIIIVVVLSLIVGVIICFSFIKHRGNPCYNCPYCNSCSKSKCSTETKKNRSSY